MNTFVFDANIPIAFKKIKYFKILEKLFSTGEYDTELTMASRNLKECGILLSGEIQKFKRFKEETSENQKVLSKLKKYFSQKSKGALHTKNDADFHCIMIALKIKPTFLVCNDRQLLWFFNEYKNKYGDKSTKDIKGYTLAHFLDLIRRSYMSSCTTKELVNTNLDIYHFDELPSLYANMERRTNSDMLSLRLDKNIFDDYLKRNQGIFETYKQNALQIKGELT